MAKKKSSAYVCNDCGADYTKWQGQCSECNTWNTLSEVRMAVVKAPSGGGRSGYSGAVGGDVSLLSDIEIDELPRIATGAGEFDLVLGGGLVTGSCVLIGGEPGAGKSTLLLQTLCHLAQSHSCLYVTGEESPQQVAMRAKRLGLPTHKVNIMAETSAETVCATAQRQRPKILVVDSIQVMHCEDISSAPGSVSQVRESAALLIRLAKQNGIILLLVGHVTKEGSLAGPKVLEHMIDCSLMLEGTADTRFRTLRSHKNRFGAVNELGVFAMTEQGLKEVANPSAIFLQRGEEIASGSVVMVVWEGTRPLLVEIQALVDDSSLGNPRRVTVGLDHNRLAMLLAVLHRHGGLMVGDQDVFVNVVGGVKVLEPSADLALILAVVSSFRDSPLSRDLMVFGEVGLSGEIRPVPSGQERLREAAKHGFKRAIVPAGNAPRQPIDGMEVIAVHKLSEALDIFDF
ncbi:MAG: DNA repair protein RadA [Gammaproteobacteria bacterium]|nr:DNA repair protein RadA [Gammaproteobacteria bacterium]MBQ0841158.1 DNA repair protein RadA [Gammaproteobacteria bacterium]